MILFPLFSREPYMHYAQLALCISVCCYSALSVNKHSRKYDVVLKCMPRHSPLINTNAMCTQAVGEKVLRA